MGTLNISRHVLPDNGILLVLAGAIESACVGDFETELDEALREHKQKIVLDLSKLTYLNSAAVAVLLDIQKSLGQSSGELILVGVHGIVRDTFEHLGVMGCFSFLDDLSTVTNSPSSARVPRKS